MALQVRSIAPCTMQNITATARRNYHTLSTIIRFLWILFQLFRHRGRGGIEGDSSIIIVYI